MTFGGSTAPRRRKQKVQSMSSISEVDPVTVADCRGDWRRFRQLWTQIEAEAPPSAHVRDVVTIEWDEFAHKIDTDAQFGEHFCRSMYQGDVFFIRNSFDPGWCRRASAALFAWGQGRPTSFHKMVDGCPDFHREIDSTITSAYSVTAVRHGYYFFRWNPDPLDLFPALTARWQYFKAVSGHEPHAFENNLPSNGVVDRLMFYQYPSGGGQLKSHVDPINNQKVIIGALMSDRGTDYQTGGSYFVKPSGELLDMEPYGGAGDFIISYPKVLHGVTPVDVGRTIDWSDPGGRWFMGMATVDSDMRESRVTAERRE